MSKTAVINLQKNNLDNMLGADAAEIGYAVAKYKDEGYDSVRIDINNGNPDSDDMLTDEDFMEDNIVYSRAINYLNNYRIAPECFDPKSTDQFTNYSCEPDSPDYILPDENSVVKYDEKNNELHVPVQSTYMMDDCDRIQLSKYVVAAALDNKNGQVLVSIDNYNKATYNNNCAVAINRYNEAVERVKKCQGFVPNHRPYLYNC